MAKNMPEVETEPTSAMNDEDVRSAAIAYYRRQSRRAWLTCFGLCAAVLVVISVLIIVKFIVDSAFLDDTWIGISFIGGLLVIGFPGACYLGDRQLKKMRRGIASYGLHACPACGNDTRTKERACSLCKNADERADAPGFWHFLMEREKNPLCKSLPVGQVFEQEFMAVQPELVRRRESRIKLAFAFAGIVAIIGVVGGLLFSPAYYDWVFYAGFGTIFVFITWSSLPNHSSKHGYCVHCKQELPPGDTPTRCPECGEAFTRGAIVFAYSNRSKLSNWLTCACFLALVGGGLFLKWLS